MGSKVSSVGSKVSSVGTDFLCLEIAVSSVETEASCSGTDVSFDREKMFYVGAGSSLEETPISLEETATSWGQTMACQSSFVETVVCERSLWTGEGGAFSPWFEVWGETLPGGRWGGPTLPLHDAWKGM